MNRKLYELEKRRETIENGGGLQRAYKQHQSGKLTARERIKFLFDEGTFVELDAFVRHRCINFGLEKVDAPAEGVVTGYGQVNGRLVYAYAQDVTVVGGSFGEMHAQKICKIMDLAMKVGAPVVGLNESGGARIQEGVDALSGLGKILYKNTLASGVIPQITAIMGACAGGGVCSPALNDFVFMVDGTSQMFFTGPQVIKTVTGEDVSIEELGGAMTHNSVSGIAHYLAKNDRDCIDQIKRLLSFLPANNMETSPYVQSLDDINKIIGSLNSIIPDNPNKPYDMNKVIFKLIDDGDFFEYQPYFANNIITGFARLAGKTIGIVANQPDVIAGCLDIDASHKAARFIRTCDSFNIPILSIVDVPGFLPGTVQEYGGVISQGAKLMYAFAEATVPKVSLIVRKAYGGAYIAMGSKELGADIVLAWPNAEIAVMGPQGAANIIFRDEIENAEDSEAMRKQKNEEYVSEFATPYKAAERGYVDDVIEPAISRQRLIDAFQMLSAKAQHRPAKKHGNIPL